MGLIIRGVAPPPKKKVLTSAAPLKHYRRVIRAACLGQSGADGPAGGPPTSE